MPRNTEQSEGHSVSEKNKKPIGREALREALKQFAATPVKDGQRRFLLVENGMTVTGIQEDKPERNDTTAVIVESTTTLHTDVIQQDKNYNA